LLKDKKLLPKLLDLYQAGRDKNDTALALAKMPDLTALNVYLQGVGAKEASLRDASRRAIDAFRDEALPVIEARHRATPFTGQALAQIQRVYNKSDAALAGPLFEGNSKPTAVADYQKFATRFPGDSEKGRTLFEGEATCAACHAVKGTGGNIGPDLTGVASKYDRAFLIESVLYPSKQILDGYRATTVAMKSGEAYSGFLRTQNERELTVVDVAGEKHVLAKADVAKTSELETSLMPEGLHAALSLADFANLIAYLESLKDPSPSSPKP
jgi:putative heme-binding domain-containing protein